ncbi:MAG: polymer-forming cytoskeletal protein, partial [Verrucomicrobia bacterium]|nr:polymer-forming cytoskeletal protein [Verrucomicrobiota bacterium]
MHLEENMETALEEGGLQIWGDVKFRVDAVLQGKIHGDVNGLKKIIVSRDAVVTGSVEGSDVRVEGEVRGG